MSKNTVNNGSRDGFGGVNNEQAGADMSEQEQAYDFMDDLMGSIVDEGPDGDGDGKSPQSEQEQAYEGGLGVDLDAEHTYDELESMMFETPNEIPEVGVEESVQEYSDDNYSHGEEVVEDNFNEDSFDDFSNFSFGWESDESEPIEKEENYEESSNDEFDDESLLVDLESSYGWEPEIGDISPEEVSEDISQGGTGSEYEFEGSEYYDEIGTVSVEDEDNYSETYVDDGVYYDSSSDESDVEESEIDTSSNVESEEEDGTSEEDDDTFDDMLMDLVGDGESESAEGSLSEQVDAEVPLEKPGMDEIKVTPDGRTLSEMLPSLRGGRRKVDEVIQDIKDEDKHVDVDGKKVSDNRYTKHVENIEKERAEQEKRKELSNKFLQRNAKFTEQEKIIMENLGINNEQFAKIMGSDELTLKEKEEVLALGKHGAEKHFKGRRYRTTVGDMAMLEFLAKFKFANTRILRWISDEPQGRTWRKLNRLRENGLVENKTIIGIPDLWGATPAGVAISGYDFDPGLRPMPKMATISSTMGVNYLAACLWFNKVNVLNLEDFPAENRKIPTQPDGRNRTRGEELVSELEIRSSLGKEINPNSTTMQNRGDQRLYDVIRANVMQSFMEWEAGGKRGESPEFAIGNEYMWILYPTDGLTLSYHVPDLVVKRDRGPNGEPRSIAVELERYDKSNDRYDDIMMAYKLDEHLYEKVVWVTPNTRVARKLKQAADNVGFDRISILPIITKTGTFNDTDIWMI